MGEVSAGAEMVCISSGAHSSNSWYLREAIRLLQEMPDEWDEHIRKLWLPELCNIDDLLDAYRHFSIGRTGIDSGSFKK